MDSKGLTAKAMIKNTVLFITYCNKKNKSSDNFEKSFKKFKYKYKILGKGEKWENFMTKIKAYHKYVSKLCIKHPDQLVCLIDCYDVLACSGGLEKKLQKFHNKNKILVSSQKDCKEYNCIELKNWWKDNILLKQNNNHYANSGFILSKCDKLLHLLDFMIELNSGAEKESDDQMALCKYIEKYPEKIDIDVNSSIIATILPIDFHKYTISSYISGLLKKFDERNKNIRELKLASPVKRKIITNNETGETPIFIHTPGMATDFMIRAEYFGKEILNGENKYEDITNKTKSFLNKGIYNPSLLVRMGFFIGSTLFFLSVMYPGIGKRMLLLLFGSILFIMWYKKTRLINND